MGPVTLNKESFINKAGVEVNVIPIMKSPCPSPQPLRRKPYRRPHSEMGYRKDNRDDRDDRGSLPDLKRSSQKSSILETVLKMSPETFLSNDSLDNDGRLSRSSPTSINSTSKGVIMNAVVDWLQKTSPFGSAELLTQRSVCTSIADITDASISVFDDDFDEKSISRPDHIIPDIFIMPEENRTLSPTKKRSLKSKKSSHLGK